MELTQFKILMQTVADGWNEGNSRKAVECFTKDATYIEPPDKQCFKGEAELYEYFGGDSAKAGDMKMVWHNIFFNEETQVGAGEYTFEMYNVIHHGVAVVELKDRKINQWREYDVRTSYLYEDFKKIDGKEFKYTIKELTS